MRTSNKILLGIFVLPLVLLATVNASLYTKYKAGHYVAMTVIEQERYMRQNITNISYVAVYGLSNFSVKPADTAKLEIEKYEHGHIHYSIHGDSLIIHGDSTIKRGAENETLRSYEAVSLYLPGDANIFADNSDVYLEGTADSTKAKSLQLQLGNSSNCEVRDFDNSKRQYFNVLSMRANGSGSIELSGEARISVLNLVLANAQFDDKGAVINKLVISADKASPLTLRGANLDKLKTSVHE